MTPEEVNTLWGKVIDDLQGEAGVRIMTEIGENTKARIENRIIEKGESDTGVGFQSIRPYSPSYEAFKKQQGKYKGYVDFQFTGRMWKNVQILPGSATMNEIQIGALAVENQEKLDKNARKWGAILAMSETEKEVATSQYVDGTIYLFRKHGL